MNLSINLIIFIVILFLPNNNYIKSIILNNESYHIIQINEIILMINNNGIYTYNSIKSKIMNHFDFDNNKKDKYILPVISQFVYNDTRYITCLKNNIIYIFNQLGLCLFSINLQNKNYNIFSIYLHAIKNDDYYFVICYNDSSFTYIKKFMYNKNTKEIKEIKYIQLKLLYNINCQIMNSDLYNDVLVCFFFKRALSYFLSIIIFDIKNELNHFKNKRNIYS